MISERRLVSSHSSFWRQVLPLGESFVRYVNSRRNRFNIPHESEFKGNRNSLISELSFRLYGAQLTTGFDFWNADLTDPSLAALVQSVVDYIARIDPNSPVELMNSSEIAAAKYWARSLNFFVINACPGQLVAMQPAFVGCGIIDQCEGDMLIGSTLWELKNVERDFRLADLKQLLTYSALNYASQQYLIDSVGLVNAKHGLYFKTSLESLARMASAMSASELLAEIVRYITVDAPSR